MNVSMRGEGDELDWGIWYEIPKKNSLQRKYLIELMLSEGLSSRWQRKGMEAEIRESSYLKPQRRSRESALGPV